MPTDGKILGFSNRWYDFAVASAFDLYLDDGTAIRLVSAPAFVATKLDAFQDRGHGDFTLSHDLEDIIAIVDGRPELLEEIRAADNTVRKYIADAFSKLVSDDDFLDSIGGHLLPDEGSQARARINISRLLAISKLSTPD